MKRRRKTKTLISSSKPLRRARSKIKKPKYLSLSTSMKLQAHPPIPETHDDPPELSMADRMFAEEEGPTTLTGLLNGTVSSTTTASEISYGGYEEDSEATRLLVRTAMRRERSDEGEEEEKWVSISEVVERTTGFTEAVVAEEEVTSGDGGGGLLLKLDYEQVLNAWSGKGKGGPFCVQVHEDQLFEELPQTVPDLDQYGVVFGTPLWDVTSKGQWSVPENSFFNAQNSVNCSTLEKECKIGIREASVLRYRQKRQNRLFAKRVRYEVRKLNAEKRPRIKGRFVRKCGD